MWLHVFGLIVAIELLLIFVVCMAAILSRNKIELDAQGRFPSLFDFSAGEKEGRTMQALLTKALAASQTDAEFEKSYKQAHPAENGLDVELSWEWLCRTLMDYRKAHEFEASTRDLAARLLEEIPRRYQLKDK